MNLIAKRPRSEDSYLKFSQNKKHRLSTDSPIPKDRGYPCNICHFHIGKYEIRDKKSLIKHYNEKHPEVQIVSPINRERLHCPLNSCGVVCDTFEEFQYHLKEFHRGRKPLFCCGRLIEQKDFAVHIKMFHQKVYGLRKVQELVQPDIFGDSKSAKRGVHSDLTFRDMPLFLLKYFPYGTNINHTGQSAE